jgi:hypothetical protein
MSRLQEQSSSSSAIASSSATAVDEAEKAFVQQSFKRALHLSNQFLLEKRGEQANKQKFDSSDDIIQIHMDCRNDTVLPWCRVDDERQGYELKIDLTANPDSQNRAMAVALQSWFEISRNVEDDGSQYLVPFCRALTGLPVTIDLLLILLRFYMQMGQPGWSIHVATVCLSKCRCSPRLLRSKKGTASEDALKEVSDILFTDLLPFHPGAIRSVVDQLNYDDNKECRSEQMFHSTWKVTPAALRKETMKTLIAFMDPEVFLRKSGEAEWFKTSLQANFTQWKSQLTELEKNDEEKAKSSIIVRARKQFDQSSLTLLSSHFETQYLHLLQRLKRLLVTFQTTWQNGTFHNYQLAGVATVFGLAVVAYRYHRRKVRALLRAAIYEALLRPAKEIVEALQLAS